MTAHPTPGLVIVAPRSSSGKTTVTLGLLRAFARRGLGHRREMRAGLYRPRLSRRRDRAPSLNLDAWSMPPALLSGLAARVTADADLALCEGLMGLFDGVPAAPGRSGSSADVAAALGWPMLLVLDVSGQSQSAAAIVKGCATYDPRVRLAGVVSTRPAAPATSGWCATPWRRWASRSSAPCPARRRSACRSAISGSCRRARRAGSTPASTPWRTWSKPIWISTPSGAPPGPPSGRTDRTAWPCARPDRDRAGPRRRLLVHVPASAAGLAGGGGRDRPLRAARGRAAGARLRRVLASGRLPGAACGRLSANRRFLDGLRAFAETRPVHGECGGYMALGRTLTDAAGVEHPDGGAPGREHELRQSAR